MTKSLTFSRASDAVPPHAWFGVSAVFHYLGPSFAVLLFPSIGVLGVAWLRIASAAALFAPWTRPWRTFAQADRRTRVLLVALGACLAVMNCAFYLALDRLPISLVAAIEFVGTIGVALYGLRTGRNLLALAVTMLGVFILIDVTWASDPLGLFWAFLNGALVRRLHRARPPDLGRRRQRRCRAPRRGDGRRLPVRPAVRPDRSAHGVSSPTLLLAAIGVGICSSVIPYVCDQLAMARLPRASFALMLALLPATATIIGAIVLAQIPTVQDLIGIALVMAGVALHKPAA